MSAILGVAIVLLALVGLGIATLFFHIVVWLLMAVLGLLVYFVPSMIAAARHHEHFFWVLMLNIVLGWSGIVWVVLVVWAILGERRGPPLNRVRADAFNPPVR
ncbi:hypothetical protein B1757_07250 [Acidithiobacillus marinus]|uniref:Superinfection immunity protein n=1 Tax=Acidithiobacillus marinus TaxID=187490 RepID=A0A2I1DM12_9PROT|nr:superinfection immunity protein [Acidithiobacillus marinus]PKY10907.1 hypothetical protein B1757_07250 [Acidithiobacillus marinus]